MDTLKLEISCADLNNRESEAHKNVVRIASRLINQGELVAIPTETVFGLAADAFNSKAVQKIFVAKSRPTDNPIIVHIAEITELKYLAQEIPYKAEKLINKFWPGPLTIIFKKTKNIPEITSGNLDTVAVRMPSLELSRDIIRASKTALAAPSANISGHPSPVSSAQVLQDLDGRIAGVINIPGFTSGIGVESTVIYITSHEEILLRPGFITIKQIEAEIGDIKISPKITNINNCDDHCESSPGTRYRHYAPKTSLVILDCNQQKYIEFIKNLRKNCEKKYAALCFDEDKSELVNIPCISYGSYKDPAEQCRRIFSALRNIDKLHVDIAYVRIPNKEGIGLAVFNRLIYASGFNINKI
ncbi:MAG: threonylcarbamoyl-AMP synthase [Candidatus Improbicoccus devescovinae]|nr:MAG: threonylcarbamoyl-AMP synthase [Candidatus Improbicoccus devescovinae]